MAKKRLTKAWIRRQLMWAMSDGRCYYCGKELDRDAFVVDHIDNSIGHQNHWSNLAVSCVQCNGSKNDIGVNEWLAWKYGDGTRPVRPSTLVRRRRLLMSNRDEVAA